MRCDAAVILAAGRGERMRPLTDHTPKPLLRAGGKALIEWHIGALAAAGIERIVINTAHLGAQIEAALGAGERYGVRIIYSREGTALETAGGIATALALLDARPFLVVNGDVVCDYPFAELRRIAAQLPHTKKHAHLVLVDNPAHHMQGDFALRGELAVADGEPKYTFSGVAAYQPALFREIAAGQRAALAPLLRQAMSESLVSAEYYHGLWLDVGTPQRLADADRLLTQRLATKDTRS